MTIRKTMWDYRKKYTISAVCVFGLFMFSINLYNVKKIYDLEKNLNNENRQHIMDKQSMIPSNWIFAKGDTNGTRLQKREKRSRHSKRWYPVGCHLEGKKPEENFNESYFLWKNSITEPQQKSKCYFGTIPKQTDLRPIRNIIIPNTGFYLVYSQVTFYGLGNTQPSVSTLVCDADDENDCTALMKSSVMQVLSEERKPDSVYQSGYFYLKTNELLEVRQSSSSVQNFFYKSGTTFFGAIYLGKVL